MFFTSSPVYQLFHFLVTYFLFIADYFKRIKDSNYVIIFIRLILILFRRLIFHLGEGKSLINKIIDLISFVGYFKFVFVWLKSIIKLLNLIYSVF